MALNALKQEYREFQESRGDVTAPGIKLLKNCISTLPVRTAECERGFSKMNVICSSLRSKLTVPQISSLTPITQFDPVTFVKSWLTSNRRSAVCSQGPARKQNVTASIAVQSLWNVMQKSKQ